MKKIFEWFTVAVLAIFGYQALVNDMARDGELEIKDGAIHMDLHK